LYSGSEDDVHALSADNHLSDTSKGRSLVSHVVSTHVSNGYEINVVLLVAFVDQVLLNGLVDVLSVLACKTDKARCRDVALNADGVDLTSDFVAHDVVLFNSDDN